MPLSSGDPMVTHAAWRRRLGAGGLGLLLALGACEGEGDQSTPSEPDPEPSLSVLDGTCRVVKFEIWSTNYSVPPAVRMLYDAAANGYVATLRIAAFSPASGNYQLSASSRDPLRVGDVASGTLTLVPPDSVRFTGATSLPGKTQFALSGTLLTLVNSTPRPVTLPPGTYQATTRIECGR